MLLAAIGLYGVIGIRLALGATRNNVLALVLRHGMKLVGIGVSLGITGALGLTRVLTAQLYEVKSSDPTTFVAVIYYAPFRGTARLLAPRAACHQSRSDGDFEAD